jgi:hypothetical protein
MCSRAPGQVTCAGSAPPRERDSSALVRDCAWTGKGLRDLPKHRKASPGPCSLRLRPSSRRTRCASYPGGAGGRPLAETRSPATLACAPRILRRRRPCPARRLFGTAANRTAQPHGPVRSQPVQSGLSRRGAATYSLRDSPRLPANSSRRRRRGCCCRPRHATRPCRCSTAPALTARLLTVPSTTAVY